MLDFLLNCLAQPSSDSLKWGTETDRLIHSLNQYTNTQRDGKSISDEASRAFEIATAAYGPKGAVSCCNRKCSLNRHVC